MDSPAPIYLDCDTGIDDALAIGYLLKTPAVEVVGIGTVSGNTSAGQAAENTLRLLGVAGRSDIPVAVGEHDWLAQPYGGGAAHVHGDNGIGGTELPSVQQHPIDESAVDLLLRLSHEHSGTLRIVAIGPLTNLARALERDPSLPERIAEVVAMGGAALAPGNITPVAEANIFHDPEAAQVVVSADWDVILVPLDITMQHVFDEGHQGALLDSGDPLARALGDMLGHYFDYYQGVFGRRSSALHDPLAAAIAAGVVRLTRAPAVPVEVDTTGGPGRGQTIVDMRMQRAGHVFHPEVRSRVALDVDPEDFASHLLGVLLGTPA
jgi:purine nucleosidase